MRCQMLAISLFLALVFPAEALDDTDRRAIRDVITKQMDSFKSDDAVGAFSYASAAIQQMFRDPDTFMTMVRSGYAPVYRPQSTRFDELKESDLGVIQMVTIVDTDGNFWTAIYTMEKAEDGQWRINGCRIIKAPSV
jgi:hypothetical protein